MANTSKFKYYVLEKKHLDDVRYLFLKSFNKKVSVDYLSHKYDSSHLGLKSVATIAYEGQRPVAFYGAIPQRFRDGKEQFFLAHACDSFTHPRYQKQGLHFNLATKSYEIMQENGIRMVYAYHSENTYYSTKKLNWQEHLQMKRFHVYNGALPISKVFNRLNLNTFIVKNASRIFRPYFTDSVINPLAIEKRIHQEYSHSFYNYKEGFNRHLTVCINDCYFYLKVGAALEVGFTECSNINNLPGAVGKLKRLAKKSGINEILFQVDPSTKQFRGLTTIVEKKPSWLIGYLLFDNSLDVDRIGFNYADLDTF